MLNILIFLIFDLIPALVLYTLLAASIYVYFQKKKTKKIILTMEELRQQYKQKHYDVHYPVFEDVDNDDNDNDDNNNDDNNNDDNNN